MRTDYRQRLFDGLEASIAEIGYPRTTIADVVRRAKTSRRTFYEHFASRDQCFIELLTGVNVDQVQQIITAVDPAGEWRAQARQALDAWIASIEERPTLMLSWIRDLPALGEPAHQLQHDAMETFIAMVQAITDSEAFRTAGIGPVSRARIIMLLGGLRELSAMTLESGGQMSDVADDAVEAAIALVGAQN